MIRRVDIDKEFAVVVKKCGGILLDEEAPAAFVRSRTPTTFFMRARSSLR